MNTIEVRKCKRKKHFFYVALLFLFLILFCWGVLSFHYPYIILSVVLCLPLGLCYFVLSVCRIYKVPYRIDVSEASIIVHYTTCFGQGKERIDKNAFFVSYMRDSFAIGRCFMLFGKQRYIFMYQANLLDKSQWPEESISSLITLLYANDYSLHKQY